MKALTRMAIAMALGMMIGGNVAKAGFVVELTETATGITQATTGGTVDINGLSFVQAGGNSIGAGLGDDSFALGSSTNLVEFAGSINLSPGSIWPSNGAPADSVTGSFIGFVNFGSGLFLLLDANTSVAGGIATIGPASASFNGITFADLGVTVGDSFVYSWGSGSNADSVTCNVVPEPSSYALMGFGLCCITAYNYRRRMTVVAE